MSAVLQEKKLLCPSLKMSYKNNAGFLTTSGKNVPELNNNSGFITVPDDTEILLIKNNSGWIRIGNNCKVTTIQNNSGGIEIGDNAEVGTVTTCVGHLDFGDNCVIGIIEGGATGPMKFGNNCKVLWEEGKEKVEEKGAGDGDPDPSLDWSNTNLGLTQVANQTRRALSSSRFDARLEMDGSLRQGLGDSSSSPGNPQGNSNSTRASPEEPNHPAHRRIFPGGNVTLPPDPNVRLYQRVYTTSSPGAGSTQEDRNTSSSSPGNPQSNSTRASPEEPSPPIHRRIYSRGNVTSSSDPNVTLYSQGYSEGFSLGKSFAQSLGLSTSSLGSNNVSVSTASSSGGVPVPSPSNRFEFPAFPAFPQSFDVPTFFRVPGPGATPSSGRTSSSGYASSNNTPRPSPTSAATRGVTGNGNSHFEFPSFANGNGFFSPNSSSTVGGNRNGFFGPNSSSSTVGGNGNGFFGFGSYPPAVGVGGNGNSLFNFSSSSSTVGGNGHGGNNTQATKDIEDPPPPLQQPSAPPGNEGYDDNAVDEEALCAICMDNPKNMAFTCGHVCCAGCAAPLLNCHICRRPIGLKIKLFL